MSVMKGIAVPLGFPFVLLAAGFVLATELLPGHVALGNLLMGSGIGFGATFAVEIWRRQQQARDLGAALYHELANRVARCCYDFEIPWSGHWVSPQRMNRFGIGKFAPDPPTVFAANADKLALFGDKVPAAMLAFYYRLSALRRDIENLRADSRDQTDINEDAVRLVASRLAFTLSPARDALQALGAAIPTRAAIEDDAWKSFDVLQPKRAAMPLRERLDTLINKAAEIRVKVEGA
jgi:hypothetical protein